MGLGIAIPFALLSLLQLQSSFEFDNWHHDRDRIFRIITDETSEAGSKKSYASSPFLLAQKMNEYPAVEVSTHVIRDFGWELSNTLKSSGVNTIFVDTSFFQVFNFPLESGVYPTEPNTLVLSHEKAEWYFGEANPVGKSLEHITHGEFKIVGVLKPFKPKTQFKSDIMLSMTTYENQNPISDLKKSWGQLNSHTFIKLFPNSKPESIQNSLSNLEGEVNNVFSADSQKSLAFNLQNFADISPAIQKLEFNPYVEDMQDIYFNFSIPLMILLLAGFNYTNLTLARSLSRSLEVGVRKVMGAKRSQLIYQFLTEAIIISLLSLCLGLLILGFMRQYIHVQWITWEVDNTYLVYLLFFCFALILGSAAGIFPALILSKYDPAKILKGSIGPSSLGKFNFRQVLTVIQFVVTLVFVFQIGHMYNQFNYMANENDNFNRLGIYNLTLKEGIDRNLEKNLNELKEVSQIGYTSQTFGNLPAESGIKLKENDENTLAYYYAVDNNYVENMQLKIIAGQNIPESHSDSASSFVLVNRKAVKSLKIENINDAIGQQIILNDNQLVQIYGVIEDFCNFNYQFEVKPNILQFNPNMFHIASLQTNAVGNQKGFEKEIAELWSNYYPFDQAVGSWLSTDLYERYYPSEDMKVMAWACGVIFLIGIMGLMGILTYSSQKRVKEIGIRKVMGATISQVTALMSWGFVKLLLIAAAIALPLGWLAGYFFTNFLFTFNNGINYSYMAGLVLFIIGIAVCLVFTSAYKSAIANPTDTLSND